MSRFRLALVCLIPLVGCVSPGMHEQLKGENRALKVDNQRLEDELFRVREDHGEASRRLAEEQNSNQLLANQNRSLAEAARNAQAAMQRMLEEASQPAELVIAGPALPAPLDNALQSFASQYGEIVAYDAGRGLLAWRGDLLFALGSDVVVDNVKAPLRRFAEIMRSAAASDFEVLVVGHTDNTPIKKEATLQRHPSNWHLSSHRAISVANFIMKEGLARDRVGIAGYSEYKPVAPNDSPESKSKNRRVEILIVRRGSLARGGS